MGRIHGIKNLITYLKSVDYPLSEQEINGFLEAKTIPHSRPYGDLIVFECSHIEWWVDLQRNKESKS
ncbi:hypothetical protein [Planococcus sp. CAU13]|uniref:hypothetical protein n=1 Tax=Planococcus sp. CAU13 TaxID=1541197 RepID=UPI00052FF8AA|nr:hypothetical protein [Planococcus sp. CAU13]